MKEHGYIRDQEMTVNKKKMERKTSVLFWFASFTSIIVTLFASSYNGDRMNRQEYEGEGEGGVQ